MTTLDTIRRLTIQYQSLGADAVKRELDGVVAAQKAAASSSDGAAKSVLSLEKQFKALERAFVPGVKAQQEFEKNTRTVSAALAQGSVSAERATALLGAMNSRLIDTAAGQVQAARNTALNAGQMQNLGYQLNDVLTMLASGSSPFQVLATQGGQVYQVLSSSPAGVGGALKELGSRFLGLIGPAGLAGAGLVGAATLGYAAWSSFTSKVQEAQIALNGVGRGSGLTVDALMATSSRGALRAGISQSMGGTLGAGFAGAGVGGTMIEDLIASTRQFSKAFGLDLAEAGKELASAFADPVKGAEELNKRFGFLSADLQTQIQRQQAAGNIEGARQTLQDAYNRALAETTTRTNVLSSAFDALKNSASNAWGRLGQSLSAPTAQEGLEAALSRQTRRGVMTRDPERRQELIGQQVMAAWEAVLNEAGKALVAATEKAANDLSLQATDVAKRLMQGESRSSLVDQRDLLSKAIGDPEVLKRMGVSAEQAREALARAQTALDNFRTPLQRMVEDGALAVAAASAFTAQQRAVVEAERARIETLRSTNSETLAGVAASNAYKLAIAESTRVLRDASRSANDNLELSRLNPYQRAQREVDFRMRDLRERVVTTGAGADPVAQAATQLASGFNSIFAEKIGQLQAQFPELRMTSGVRTEAEQRTLRALYGPNGAAAPGNSRHEAGLAADFSGRNLSEEQKAAVIAAAQRMGLTVIPSNNGAMHIEGPRSWAGQGSTVPGGGGNVASTLRGAEAQERARIEQEMYGNVITNANNELEKQQRALQAQIATFGRSTGEVVAAAKAEEMLLQFKQQGVPLDAQRIQQINAVAAAYGRQAQAAEDSRLAQQRTIQTMDAFREAGASAFSGVAMAMIQGKSASEALQQSLMRLLQRLLDMAANQLMAALLGNTGTAGGGLIGSAIGGLFGGGGGSMNYGVGVMPTNIVPGSFYDVGGVVGPGGGRPGGMVPASAWNGAPHFSAGGRVGARPIIAHDGEIILNAAQQRNTASMLRAAANNNGGSRAPVINVHLTNKSAPLTPGETKQETGPDGSINIEMALEEMVAKSLTKGAGRQVMRNRYGMSPTMGRR
jgi:hypothetical protein